MAKTARLAWRNLGRNRRRTLLTGSALAVGTCLCVATYGLMDGMNADILRSLTRLDLGHVQIHHKDYPRKRTLKLTIPGARQLVERARDSEGVAGVAPRVYGFGLVGHRDKSAGVQLVGVDPRREPEVTELHLQRTSGRYLPRAPTPWPRGRALTREERERDRRLTREREQDVLEEIDALQPLEPAEQGGGAATPVTDGAGASGEQAAGASGADSAAWSRKLADRIAPPPKRPPPVFLGVNLARILRAKLGDRLHLMSRTVDGLAAETFFTVRGIYETGTDSYDRTRIYMHLRDLQRFLRLDGRVHEITIRARSGRDAAALAESLGGWREESPVLIRPWNEVRPDIENMLRINEVSTGLMVFIIFIVAVLGVVNTMLMAVFERTRELGMLKAIGMSGGRILWLVLVETTLLVVVSSIVGTALGVGLDLYMMVYGVDLTAFSEGISFGGMGVSPVLHGAITTEGLTVPAVSLSMMCFVAALYPAVRAARMRPAQGMRDA